MAKEEREILYRDQEIQPAETEAAEEEEMSEEEAVEDHLGYHNFYGF